MRSLRLISASLGSLDRKGPQAVLRSKNIYGPYEWRTVLAKGDTDVQAPHQGGYVETRFLTFASAGEESQGPQLMGKSVQLRMHVEDETVRYAYSLDDGKTFVPFGDKSKMRFSWWKGVRPALFTYISDATASKQGHADFGHADFDWVHVRQIAPERN